MQAGREDTDLSFLLMSQKVSFQKGSDTHCVLCLDFLSLYVLSCKVTATTFQLKPAELSSICVSTEHGDSLKCKDYWSDFSGHVPLPPSYFF